MWGYLSRIRCFKHYLLCCYPVESRIATKCFTFLCLSTSVTLSRGWKRVISTVFPGTHYKEGLTTAGLYSLSERRGEACLTRFHEIASNPRHKLSSLLYPRLLISHIVWGELELLNNLKRNQIDLNISLFQLAFVQWNFNLNSRSVMHVKYF